MNTSELRDYFMQMLRGSRTWSHAVRTNPPSWVGELCTRLAVLMGDDKVAYVVDHADYVGGRVKGAITIFMATRLIRSEVSARLMPYLPGEGPDEIKVWALPRSTLSRLEVEGGMNLLTDAWPDEWPGGVSVRAAYGAESVSIDCKDMDSSQRKAFCEFLPSLLADLGLPGRERREDA